MVHLPEIVLLSLLLQVKAVSGVPPVETTHFHTVC